MIYVLFRDAMPMPEASGILSKYARLSHVTFTLRYIGVPFVAVLVWDAIVG